MQDSSRFIYFIHTCCASFALLRNVSFTRSVLSSEGVAQGGRRLRMISGEESDRSWNCNVNSHDLIDSVRSVGQLKATVCTTKRSLRQIASKTSSPGRIETTLHIASIQLILGPRHTFMEPRYVCMYVYVCIYVSMYVRIWVHIYNAGGTFD